MLIKLGLKNQLTLPEEAVTSVDAAEYFEVTVEDGRIILTPVCLQGADAVRQKLDELGITEQDIEDAVASARR